MRHLLILITFLFALVTSAAAQDRGKFDLDFAIGRRSVEPALSYHAHRFERPFGIPFNVDVLPFAGSRLENQALFGGFALAVPFQIDRQVSVSVGFFGRFNASNPIDGGFFIGIRLSKPREL